MNADALIDVTFSVITTEESELHPLKENKPMLSTVSGMLIFVRELQFWNNLSPIFVILQDKSTDSKLLHPLKAKSSMVVTLSGMTRGLYR